MGEMHWMMSPFTAPNVTLLLPLSPRVLLTSRMEEVGTTPFVMDDESVALVNTHVSRDANQVYAQANDWRWIHATEAGGIIKDWQGYVEAIADVVGKTT
jgi:hypothetical protein